MHEHDISSGRMLSEGDLALVDCMQINPRITWDALGTILGVDPTTVARRWNRLCTEGAAWTTVMLGPKQASKMAAAYIEIDCKNDRSQDVLEWLYTQPHVVTVQHLSGELTLWCAVFAPHEIVLSDYIISTLSRLPGVHTVRTNIGMRVFDSSRQWRLKVIDRSQASRVKASLSGTTSSHEIDQIDRRLFSLLARDARIATSELSERAGISQRSAQRRINYLVNSGEIEFRCDLARRLAGWHSGAILWIDVPEQSLEKVGRDLVSWEETRTCAAIAGRTNLMLTLALHSAKDLYTFARKLTATYPKIRIVDRQIILRQYKLYGHILSPKGQKIATANVDPWFLAEE